MVKGVWAWRRISLASEVGQYLGCISDEVEGKRLESGLSRKQEVHGDLSLARQLVDAGREHLHNAAESSRNAVALLRNDDILVPSAQVTNGEEHNNADAVPSAFMKAVLKDMEAKAYQDSLLEKELMDSCQTKDSTPKKKEKHLWEAKMQASAELAKKTSALQSSLDSAVAQIDMVTTQAKDTLAIDFDGKDELEELSQAILTKLEASQKDAADGLGEVKKELQLMEAKCSTADDFELYMEHVKKGDLGTYIKFFDMITSIRKDVKNLRDNLLKAQKGIKDKDKTRTSATSKAFIAQALGWW